MLPSVQVIILGERLSEYVRSPFKKHMFSEEKRKKERKKERKKDSGNKLKMFYAMRKREVLSKGV